MRITVRSSLRASTVFRLIEALEPRTLMTGLTQVLPLISMTGGAKDGTGAGPQGLIRAHNGDFYGTTITGGPKGYGNVFKIFTSGTEQKLIALAPFTGTGKNGNGISPRGPMAIDSAGNLWGVTTGGGAYNRGTVWEIDFADLAATANSNATTSIIHTVYSFAGTDGSYPISGLVMDSDENVWGTTLGVLSSAAQDKAEVFKLAHVGTVSTPTSLTTFAFPKGVQPAGELTLDASTGDIYGVTRNGGDNKLGSIFKILKDSGSLTASYFSFTKATGTVPNGTLIVDGTTIYGTASQQGANGGGTIFQISGTTPAATVVTSFKGSNGFRPLGNLLTDGSGNFYGVTATGGKSGVGTVFKWSLDGANSTLAPAFSFKGKSTGINPTGPLIANDSGHFFNALTHFFGTTYSGGTKNIGAVFELKP